jgi:protein TonB
LEISPSFPGGNEALYKFIKQNLKYPPRRADCAGVVFVRFLVNEDGTLSNLEVIKGLCEICDNNALEVFRNMPKWVPGKINNKPAKIRMICPIRYEI